MVKNPRYDYPGENYSFKLYLTVLSLKMYPGERALQSTVYFEEIKIRDSKTE